MDCYALNSSTLSKDFKTKGFISSIYIPSKSESADNKVRFNLAFKGGESEGGLITVNVSMIDQIIGVLRKFSFEQNLIEMYSPKDKGITHVQLAYRDFMRRISDTLHAALIERESLLNANDCIGNKEKISEKYVDFKYKDYPSKCEKYSDGFQIMDSMVKLYKDCPDLDKGTGKRSQFKEQFYKLRNLKEKHCN